MSNHRNPAATPAPAAQPGPTQVLLQRLIKHFHLTQLEIQRETGVDQSRLSRYFRGRVPRALDDVFKLQELERKMEDQERKAAKKASKEKEAAPS